MMSLMDKFINSFRPERGDGAFEQLLELQKQTDPNNAELPVSQEDSRVVLRHMQVPREHELQICVIQKLKQLLLLRTFSPRLQRVCV
jgi:hypothetical protein